MFPSSWDFPTDFGLQAPLRGLLTYTILHESSPLSDKRRSIYSQQLMYLKEKKNGVKSNGLHSGRLRRNTL